MSEDIRITWEVSDGYAGASAPQRFRVNPENYRGMSKEDIENELSIEVQSDFESKVSWVCDVSIYADEILKALEASPEEEE